MDFNIISGEIRNLRLIKLSIIIVELSAKIFLVSLVKKEGARMGERFYFAFCAGYRQYADVSFAPLML